MAASDLPEKQEADQKPEKEVEQIKIFNAVLPEEFVLDADPEFNDCPCGVAVFPEDH